MPNRDDERRRKEMLDRWKTDQRAAARVKLPLPDAQMQAMFDMLGVEFPRQGCNRTLRLVQAWLVSKGLPVGPVIDWLHANACNCDCEALANAEQTWRDAIHDVDR